MTEETDMSNIKQTLIIGLATAGAIALATEQAHAWGGYYSRGSYGWRPHAFAYRPYAANFTYRPPYAYRSYYSYHPFEAYRPYFGATYAAAQLYYGGYNTYSYHPLFTGYYGSGTFSDGRRIPGTNYNPNQ
jgi:hypothetical protein